MTDDNETITYVLRCHSVSTLPKLKTALLSVAAQSYHSARALVAVQDLPDSSLTQITSSIRELQDRCKLDVEVRNFSFPQPGDHRGALLNRALDVLESRYVGFLDYDDIVYPDHAKTLIQDISRSKDPSVSASFGGCTLAFYDDLLEGEINITGKRVFSSNPSVSSCLIANCFPIHSYIVDLRRLQKVPRFDEEFHLYEDYIFLLELLESYPVSTNCATIPLCEYRLNNNNSNTVSVESESAIQDQNKNDLWASRLERIEKMKIGRSFRVPYSEIVEPSDNSRLSRQPFLRGLLVCSIAKSIRKKYGEAEAGKFLTNPKRYSRSLPSEKRSLSMKIFF
ncbi:glycosyltransferase family 2 protein [Poseidonocella sp. HB161398]|uniref:glycosyltransferase family 2 protein n=1 Tax=Poseidonocella sp. HB161398 TaxID=2320855 RepID=UPI00110996EA|nr:glycosyltransferase family 2 protein [Poseidonocella sp. HB161398]